MDSSVLEEAGTCGIANPPHALDNPDCYRVIPESRCQWGVPPKPGAHPSTQHLARESQDGVQAFFSIRIHTNTSEESENTQVQYLQELGTALLPWTL